MGEQNKNEKSITNIQKVTTLYLILASMWILFSDYVLRWFVPDMELYSRLQIYKGWFFVLVTGLLLYFYLKPNIEELKISRKALLETKKDLLESEEKYRELVNSINDTVLVIDFNENIIDVNDSAIRTLGYTKEELLSMKIQNIDSTLSIEEIRNHIDKTKTNKKQLFETTHITKNGTIIPVEIKTSLVEYSGRSLLLSVARDITSRREAQKREQHLRMVLQAIRNVNQLITKENDPEHLIKKACENLTETLGYYNAWIAIVDADSDVISTASSGYNSNFPILNDQMKQGIYPVCMKDALENKHLMVIEKPDEYCENCPLASEYNKHSVMCYHLQYNNRSYGVMAVSIPCEYANLEEEHDLFIEVADDLAFAFYKFEIEEKRRLSEQTIKKLNRFNQSTLDSLDANICVLDENGNIIKTNRSWNKFAINNSGDPEKVGPGTNYIQAAKKATGEERKFALDFVKGIEDVISGKAENFELEYPCHSPKIKRWFLGKVTPFEDNNFFPRKVVISHVDITGRVKAQKEMIHSHNLMKYIIEHNRSAIAVHDKDLNYIYVSQKYRDEYDLNEKDIIGKHHYEVVPDLPQKWRDVHQKALKGEISSAEDDMFERDDGTVMWTRWECRPWYESDGSIGGIIIYTEDITARKKMELALKQSEEDYRRLFEDHAAVKLLIDPETGKIVEGNKAAEAYYGWSREELRGMPLHKINVLPSEDINAEIKKAVSDERLHFEFRHQRADGSVRDVEVFSSVTKMKEKKLLHSILHDITDRKSAEIALRESEKKFRSYVENAPDGIFITDEKGNCIEVNKTACKISGYNKDELLKMKFNDLIDTRYRRKDDESFQDLKKDGFVSVELSMVNKDGNVCWLRKDAAKLSDKRYLVFIIDITQKKKAEYALIKAKMLAEESSRAKSEFMANISHELRTPLTAVIGFSDVLSSNNFGELNEKQFEFVSHINKSGNHLLELINNILDLSRIETGKMELECSGFSLKQVIEDVTSLMSPIASKKNIDVEINNSIKEDHIIADRLKFKQIMINLLSNAIKFTPDAGKVSVNIERSDHEFFISVSDNGIGIPKNMLNNIFNPFMQVDSSNKRRYAGTGLGLSLVKEFVEMHDGRVWVESEEGEGSSFTFTIPVSHDEPLESAQNC